MQVQHQNEQVISMVEAVYHGQRAVQVEAADILLLMEGKRAIAKSAHKVGEALGIEPQMIVTHLFNNMYYVEPSGTLVLVIMLPEHGLEMFAEVPERMWTFKRQSVQYH